MTRCGSKANKQLHLCQQNPATTHTHTHTHTHNFTFVCLDPARGLSDDAASTEHSSAHVYPQARNQCMTRPVRTLDPGSLCSSSEPAEQQAESRRTLLSTRAARSFCWLRSREETRSEIEHAHGERSRNYADVTTLT